MTSNSTMRKRRNVPLEQPPAGDITFPNHSATMFHSFSAAPGAHLSKRRKVTRACEYCREHRVRCESITPCPECVANKVTCNRTPPPSVSPRERYEDRHDSSQRKSQRTRRRETTTTNILSHALTSTRVTSSAPVGDAPSTRPVNGPLPASHQIDSMTGFISRINAFCAGITPLSTYVPTHDTGDDATPSHLQDSSSQAECDLSDGQIKRLLAIFQSKLYPQMPIVRSEDITLESPGPQPLRDAVVAYTMQYVYYSGLNQRILGLQWTQFSTAPRGTRVGMPYFERCLSETTTYSTLTGPSMAVIRCYCLMTVYLLNAGQYQAAYNTIGLGVRAAQSLDLHRDPPVGRNNEYGERLRRVWWTLIHLDFRCSRHLGKPVTMQSPEMTCAPPHVEPTSIDSASCLYYHDISLQLTATALSLIDSLTNPPGPEATSPIEARAQLLSHALHDLYKWREQLDNQPAAIFHVDPESTPMPPYESTEAHQAVNDSEEDNRKRSPVRILLTTLLELQYHDIIITLHRVFIQFPTPSLTPRNTPLADVHAATALNHAIATIYLVHTRMSNHEALYGCCELYQYQRNAVLTLIGFMLAYPYCHRFAKARKYVDLALEIFEAAGPHNIAAQRSAELTRQLCAKVDTLVLILNVNHGDVPETPGLDPTLTPDKTQAATSTVTVSEGSDCETRPIDPAAAESIQWPSWPDMIDSSSWPSYYQGVNETFPSLPGIGTYQNAFFDEYLCQS